MPQLTLAQAQTIVSTALKLGMDQKMQPLAVVVLDERGVPKAYAAQDGTSLRRFEIASGKAHGALSFGIGSRALAKRAAANPHFIAAVTHAVGGSLVPVPGGVLIRTADRAIVGGLSLGGYMSLAFYRNHPDRVRALLIIDTGPGFNSDNDEAAAVAGIAAAGLTADPGEG